MPWVEERWRGLHPSPQATLICAPLHLVEQAHAEALTSAQQAHAAALAQATARHEAALAAHSAAVKETADRTADEHAAAIKRLKAAHAEALAQLREDHAREMRQVRALNPTVEGFVDLGALLTASMVRILCSYLMRISNHVSRMRLRTLLRSKMPPLLTRHLR
jgi:hypothetical protein